MFVTAYYWPCGTVHYGVVSDSDSRNLKMIRVDHIHGIYLHIIDMPHDTIQHRVTPLRSETPPQPDEGPPRVSGPICGLASAGVYRHLKARRAVPGSACDSESGRVAPIVA